MAIRPLTRTTDTLRLLAPGDDAIHFDAFNEKGEDGKPTPEAKRLQQILARYLSGEDLDARQLPLVQGAEPTWWTVRTLNARELAIAGWDGSGNIGALAYDLLRLSLVEAEGFGDWKPVRETYHGVQALTLESVSAIPEHVAQFLAQAVTKVSTTGPFSGPRSKS